MVQEQASARIIKNSVLTQGERCYHEALINAFVRGDYLVNGSEVHIDIYDDRMEIYSPGGRADGVQIQNRDPLTVPSTRRNLLLADIFNRLGYMERKGSGFEKIVNGYEFQVTFDESKKPTFYSEIKGWISYNSNDQKGV